MTLPGESHELVIRPVFRSPTFIDGQNGVDRQGAWTVDRGRADR